MKFNDILTSFVSKDLKNGKIPMLLGEPGIGKSSWTEALAASMQTKCFTLAVNQLADKADLTGARLVPTGTEGNFKQVFFPHETIMDAVEYAEQHPRETPVLFLDEINRTTADVTSAALSIPTMRRIGSVKLPSNLKVMIAGNDKGNITSLDEASVSRFVLYRVEPDTQTFIDISPNLNPYVKNVLVKKPELIFCKSVDVATVNTSTDDDDDNGNSTEFHIDDIISDAEGMQQITTPRTIVSLSDWLNEFGHDEMVQMLTTPATVEGIDTNLLMEGIVGHAGYTNFAIAVEEEIRVNINSLNVNANSNSPKKPQCYDQLKNQPDINALNAFIAGMNDAELSAAMTYAIYEKVDNKFILTQLAARATKLEPSDMTMLMQMVASETYDRENWETVVNSGSRIGTILEMYSNS